MKRKCEDCGMIRAQKDMVHLKDKKFICFSCFNKTLKNNKLSSRNPK